MPVRQTYQMNAPSGNNGGLILGEPLDVKGRRLAGGLPWMMDLDVTNRVRLGDTLGGGRSGIATPTVPYGGFGLVGRTVTAGAVAVTVDDAVIRCDTSGGTVTLNLPAAASAVDQILMLIKTSATATVVIDPSGAELINGQATYSFFNFLSPVIVRSNGTSWDVFENEPRIYNLFNEDNPTATNTGAITTLATSPSLFFSGRPVVFWVAGSMFNNNGGTPEFMQVNFALQIDAGADVKCSQWTSDVSNVHGAFAGNQILVPTPGNHTISLRWQRASGAGTSTMDFNDFFYVRAASW